VVGYSVAKEPTETPAHLLLTQRVPMVQSYRLHLLNWPITQSSDNSPLIYSSLSILFRPHQKEILP